MQIYLSKEIGPNLGSRKVAAQLRDRLIAATESVEIDFSDVELMSHSFADELFGKIAESFGLDAFKNRFILKNLNKDDQLMIRSVVSERLKPKAS